MPIPDYQTLMLPLLRRLGDGEEHAIRDLVNDLANEFHLTEEEREALLPSGTQPVTVPVRTSDHVVFSEEPFLYRLVVVLLSVSSVPARN